MFVTLIHVPCSLVLSVHFFLVRVLCTIFYLYFICIVVYLYVSCNSVCMSHWNKRLLTYLGVGPLIARGTDVVSGGAALCVCVSVDSAAVRASRGRHCQVRAVLAWRLYVTTLCWRHCDADGRDVILSLRRANISRRSVTSLGCWRWRSHGDAVPVHGVAAARTTTTSSRAARVSHQRLHGCVTRCKSPVFQHLTEPNRACLVRRCLCFPYME